MQKRNRRMQILLAIITFMLLASMLLSFVIQMQ